MLTTPPLWPAPFCCDVAGHASPTTQWAVICCGAVVIIYVLLRSGRRAKADPLGRPAGQGTLAQERNVERQMQNLLVELSAMAQQITAQLDTRTTKLGLMIDDADEKAARLQRLLDDCRAALAAAAAPAAPTMSPTAPPPQVDAEPPSLALANESDARHQRVYALADQGWSAADIARELNRPRGEIDLIQALRPR